MSEHKGSILAYLRTPRKYTRKTEGADEFTYRRVTVPTRDKRRPGDLRWAWEVLYMGQPVIVLDTKKEVLAFIKEKLEN